MLFLQKAVKYNVLTQLFNFFKNNYIATRGVLAILYAVVSFVMCMRLGINLCRSVTARFYIFTREIL